jgi:hypothetical protein
MNPVDSEEQQHRRLQGRLEVKWTLSESGFVFNHYHLHYFPLIQYPISLLQEEVSSAGSYVMNPHESAVCGIGDSMIPAC